MGIVRHRGACGYGPDQVTEPIETPPLAFAVECPRCRTRGYRQFMEPRALCLRCGARRGETALHEVEGVPLGAEA